MKKIMVVKGLKKNTFGKPVDLYLDVSSTKLMDRAFKWIFDKSGMKEDMEYEIENNNYSNNTVFMQNCDICKKNGKAGFKNMVISCPKCNGIKRDIKSLKRWVAIINNFENAKKGNIKSIKKFLKDKANDCESFIIWDIEKIIETK